MVPENLSYTKEHEWIKIDGANAVIGISDYAQEELGDVVFVELPEPGATIKKGDNPVTLESVKAVSSVYSPFDGLVTAINTLLNDEPEMINNSPYEEGWIYKMTVTGFDNDELMNSIEYQNYIDELG